MAHRCMKDAYVLKTFNQEQMLVTKLFPLPYEIIFVWPLQTKTSNVIVKWVYLELGKKVLYFSENFFISRFTNPPTVILRKVRKKKFDF